MKSIVFLYPTNRLQLISEVGRGISPDNALYGANHLTRFGYRVKIKDISTKLEKIFDILLAPLHRFFSSQIDVDFKLPRALLQLPALNSANAIITTTDGIGLAVCFLKRLNLVKPPIIYTVGLFYIQGKMKHDLDKNKNTLFIKLFKWILSGANHIVFHAPIEKEKLANLGLYNPATCSFVPMGSDHRFFKKGLQKKSSNLILSVGKDRARDYETLLKAAKILPALSFVIICREKNIVGLEIPENTKVYFDLPYKEVLSFYQKASIIVIPIKEMYRSSGQMTLTDGMQVQKPIIISDVVGISHYPLKNGSNVLKVPSNNPRALANSISLVFSDHRLRKKLEKNTRIFAKRFSTEHYAKDISSVIKQTLDSIKLNPISKDDLEYLRKIRNQNRKFFLNNKYISKYSQQKWYSNYSFKKNDYMFLLTLNQKKLGAGAIYNIDEKNKTAEIGRFIIDKFFKHKGYGKILLSKIEFIAFNQLNLKKVTLEVLSSNEAAVNLYKASGFKIYDGNRNSKTILMAKNKLPSAN